MPNNHPIQDVDKEKEFEENQDPMSTMNIVDSTSYQMPLPKGSSSASIGLEASISKKCRVVPITIPIEDMVNKCLAKKSKSKKLKTEVMIDIDDDIGH